MGSNEKVINKKVVELIETYNFYFSYFPSDLFEQFKIRILKYERCITFVMIISTLSQASIRVDRSLVTGSMCFYKRFFFSCLLFFISKGWLMTP